MSAEGEFVDFMDVDLGDDDPMNQDHAITGSPAAAARIAELYAENARLRETLAHGPTVTDEMVERAARVDHESECMGKVPWDERPEFHRAWHRDRARTMLAAALGPQEPTP